MGWFGSFFGSDQRKDIRNANAKATAALDQGYQQSNQYYDDAYDLFSPYAEQGSKANDFYYNALGLNGDEARSQAQGVITSDPMFQGQMGQESNALLKQLNARGQSGGGLAQIAGQRVLQQNYFNHLDRYRDAGTQGFQATGAQAGLKTGQGDNAYGYGATKAGQAVNYGNAMASSRNIGINNLTGLIAAGTGAYNAFMKPGVK